MSIIPIPKRDLAKLPERDLVLLVEATEDPVKELVNTYQRIHVIERARNLMVERASELETNIEWRSGRGDWSYARFMEDNLSHLQGNIRELEKDLVKQYFKSILLQDKIVKEYL